MAIGLSEEHEALRRVGDRLGGAKHSRPGSCVPPSRPRTRSAPFSGRGSPSRGCSACTCPEEDGGSGYGLLETAVAVEALGERVGAPARTCPPCSPSAAILASDGKAHAELLPGLADGTLTGAVALAGSITGTRGEDGALIVGGVAELVLGGCPRRRPGAPGEHRPGARSGSCSTPRRRP